MIDGAYGKCSVTAERQNQVEHCIGSGPNADKGVIDTAGKTLMGFVNNHRTTVSRCMFGRGCLLARGP